ncbi:hypothetical protein [uncultured Draconibacterium sp.]|uniref:hypothetical protein n=1 Tax=uncultured Draconibacterium sp. TaxID=1573823 RepID=UPI0025F46EF6|nr:hypothetical protein [uncultured Draconibacterium sp.]
MKTNISIYILSLIVLVTGIVLTVENPDSGRMQLIAGGLTFLGFTLNILSFLKTYFQRKAELNKQL